MIDRDRINYIDMAKGIAITGIFLGHHLFLPSHITTFFWSWHIPLFFFITGFCSNKLFCVHTWDIVKNGIKDLFVPYLFTSLLLSTIIIIVTHNTALFLSPIRCLDRIGNEILYKDTPMWFLLALLWGRVLVNLTKRFTIGQKLLCYMLLFITGWTIGLFCGKNDVQIPLNMARGIICPIYIFAGRLFRQFSDNFKIFGGVFAVTSILLLYFGKFVSFNYFYYDFPIGIMNIATSSLLCISVMLISKELYKIKPLVIFCKVLSFIGKYTLYILCVHTLEIQLNIKRFSPEIIGSFAPIVIFILICLSIIVAKRIPIVNTIYKLRTDSK